MDATKKKFKLNISAKILILVLSLAILLASFGGYSVYVINSVGLKIERLNTIESELETKINSMNASLIQSSSLVSGAALALSVVGADQSKEDHIKAKESYDQTITKADIFSKAGLEQLESATGLIKKLVPSGLKKNKDPQKQNPFVKLFKDLIEPPINEDSKNIYKRLKSNLIMIRSEYDAIMDGQNSVKQAVVEYNAYIINQNMHCMLVLTKN